MNQKNYALYFVFLSITTIFFIFIIIFFNNTNTKVIDMQNKIFLASIFIAICFIGIISALRPKFFKKISNNKKNKHRITTNHDSKKFKGHHPDCPEFKSHTLVLNNKTFCAGCIGLAIGAIVSILSMIIYIFLDIHNLTVFKLLIFLGLIMIGWSFIEIMIAHRNPLIHILSNTLLVLSFLIITISIYELTNNLLYGFIIIIFSLTWLETRIQLSNWKHTQICKNCKENCKMY